MVWRMNGSSVALAVRQSVSGRGHGWMGPDEDGALWREPRGGVIWVPRSIDALAPALVDALPLRGTAIAVLLDRSASALRLTAGRALDTAEQAPYGIVVDAMPHDPRAVPLTAALRLAAALIRQRSEVCARALDALDDANGNAAAAARTLGCSGQAVRAHRLRGHHAATELLIPLLTSLLAPPDSASPAADRGAGAGPGG